MRHYRRSYILPYFVDADEIYFLVGVIWEDPTRYPQTYTYNMLGGICLKDESSGQCAIRELCEETGSILQLQLEHIFQLKEEEVKGQIWISPIGNLIELKNLINRSELRNDPHHLFPKCAEQSFIDVVSLTQLRDLPVVDQRSFSKSITYSYIKLPQTHARSNYQYQIYQEVKDKKLGTWFSLAQTLQDLSPDRLKQLWIHHINYDRQTQNLQTPCVCDYRLCSPT